MIGEIIYSNRSRRHASESTDRSIRVFGIVHRRNSVIELHTASRLSLVLVIPQNCKTFELLNARTKLTEPYEVFPYLLVIGVDDEVISLATHKVQSIDDYRLHVADFSGYYGEVVILDLHEERAHVETSVDKPESVFVTELDVEDGQRCEARCVCALLKDFQLE